MGPARTYGYVDGYGYAYGYAYGYVDEEMKLPLV